MALPGEKNISAFITPEVSEQFKQQCESRGFTKYRAVEGALRLWVTLDPIKQLELIEGRTTPVFSKNPDENEIYVELDDLARKFAAVNEKIRRNEAGKPKISRKRKAL